MSGLFSALSILFVAAIYQYYGYGCSIWFSFIPVVLIVLFTFKTGFSHDNEHEIIERFLVFLQKNNRVEMDNADQV